MALRNIITQGNELLNKVSKSVTEFDDRLFSLLDDMKDTLEFANGAGLAAVQVGILRRIVVIIIDGEVIELINPEIVKASGEQNEIEGCLSCPGIYGITKRPYRVTCKAFDRYGKPFKVTGTRLLAKAICHELDHLDGKLFLDKVIRFLSEEELSEDN